MKLTADNIASVVKKQMTIWLLAILFATVYALFAKLIWTAKFPILIFLPIAMVGFALAAINSIKTTLTNKLDSETAS